MLNVEYLRKYACAYDSKELPWSLEAERIAKELEQAHEVVLTVPEKVVLRYER